jgi:hypothetical protein
MKTVFGPLTEERLTQYYEHNRNDWSSESTTTIQLHLYNVSVVSKIGTPILGN